MNELQKLLAKKTEQDQYYEFLQEVNKKRVNAVAKKVAEKLKKFGFYNVEISKESDSFYCWVTGTMNEHTNTHFEIVSLCIVKHPYRSLSRVRITESRIAGKCIRLWRLNSYLRKFVKKALSL